MHWLQPLLDSHDPMRPTLVLCRTQAAMAEAKRFVASNGGRLAIHFSMLHGLAASIAPKRLPEGPRATESLPSSGLWARVGDRPQLRRTLHGHLVRAHLLDVPRDQTPFADLFADSLPPAACQSLRALTQRIASHGTDLGPDQHYGRVFAIGFGDVGGADDAMAQYHRQILAGLGAQLLEAQQVHGGALTLPRSFVADAVAEARTVAQWVAEYRQAGGTCERVLVLVCNNLDAERIRCALLRSGVAATDDGSRALTEHALCTWLREVLPWLVDSAAAISAVDLRATVHSRALGSKWRDIEKTSDGADADFGSDDSAVDEAIAPTPTKVSRMDLSAALAAAGLARASATAWAAALQDVAKRAGYESVRVAASKLAYCMDKLAKLQGSSATLGDLRALLDAFGASVFVNNKPDFLAMGIVGALASAKDEPATLDALDEALDGARSQGSLHKGTVILPYSAYDGRPSDLLILTGLHSQAFGKPPAPDPFFDSDALAKLGILGGERWLDALESQLCRAARRAGQTRAVVIERDATGRKVAPYAALTSAAACQAGREVTFEPLAKATVGGSYGMATVSPEVLDFARIEVRNGPIPEAAPTASFDYADALARQATLEWLRSGSAGEAGPGPNLPAVATTEDYLLAVTPRIPPWLRPWLGDVTAVAEARLPADQSLSVTGGFEALLHCGFQGYAKLVLRLKDDEAQSEDLDSRQIGDKMHKALEGIACDPRWRPLEADLPQARDQLTATLKTLVAQQFTIDSKLSAALQASASGTAERWVRQIDAYVPDRVRAQLNNDALVKATTKSLEDDLDQIVEQASAWMEATAQPWNPKGGRQGSIRKMAVTSVLLLLEDRNPTGDEFFARAPGHKPEKLAWAAAMDQPQLRNQVTALAPAFADRRADMAALNGAITHGTVEWQFGYDRHTKTGEPLTIDLGAERVAVHGRIDRAWQLKGSEGSAIQLADFKTSKTAFTAAQVAKGILQGLKPQTALYTIALRQTISAGKGPAEFVLPRIAAFGLDQLRFVRGKRADKGLALTTELETDLDAFAALAGRAVQRARQGEFALVPHPKTCPAVREKGHDYCPYLEACRFRQYAGGIALEHGDDADDDSEDATS